jgi:hypothetical protein
MRQPTDFIREGKLLAPLIDAEQPAAASLLAAIAATTAGEQLAALAIIAGRLQLQEAAGALLTLLGRDGIAGRAAAWALGQLPRDAGQAAAGEAALLAAISAGGVDVRDNAYQALAVLSARGLASAQLAGRLGECVQAEIDRAKAGGSGLGEQACRVLAVLGSPQLAELIQRVIENDRYCDRFELQRLRKVVEEGGPDRSLIKALSAPWTSVFHDQLYQEPVAAPPAPAKADPKVAAKSPGAQGVQGHGVRAQAPSAPTSPTAKPSAPAAAAGTLDGDHADGSPADDDGQAGQPALPPIDWKAFAASPEATGLPPQVLQLAAQLGPLLEQLSARAVRAALADLSGQEFAALLLQVLPQALPPQHVQLALSPPAVNAYQAIAKYLVRTGLATHGQELIDAVKLVRQELTNQIRQSGILNGPDYRDPDDKPSPLAGTTPSG